MSTNRILIFPKKIASSVSSIKIDRIRPFLPSKFESDSGDTGFFKIAEQNKRSLALTEIDISKIKLEEVLSMYPWIWANDQLERFNRENCLLLDGQVCQTLWKNPRFIPKEWKRRVTGNTLTIVFGGTLIQRYQYYYVPYMQYINCRWRIRLMSLDYQLRGFTYWAMLKD